MVLADCCRLSRGLSALFSPRRGVLCDTAAPTEDERLLSRCKSLRVEDAAILGTASSPLLATCNPEAPPSVAAFIVREL
jgi:hypothetical protein